MAKMAADPFLGLYPYECCNEIINNSSRRTDHRRSIRHYTPAAVPAVAVPSNSFSAGTASHAPPYDFLSLGVNDEEMVEKEDASRQEPADKDQPMGTEESSETQNL
jgi:hypothetical protein